MIRYILKRTLYSILLIVGLSFFVYLLIYLAPADPAQMIAAQRIGGVPDAEQIAWVRTEYGLDRPIGVQYIKWLQRTALGDLGYSIRTDKPISQEIGKHIHFSFVLGGLAMLFVLAVAVPMGIWSAQSAGQRGDHLVRFQALMWVSVPDFWLGFLLILVFAVHLGWLPAFGAKSWQHYLLPIATLGLGHAARLSRLLRSLLLDQLQNDYLRTARSKGLRSSAILRHHLLPNVAVPFITVAMQQFSMLISGTVIVETLFSFPGLGNYYVQAVNYRDIPVIQATVLLFAGMILVINLLIDLSYTLFDPRIRYT